MVNLDFSSVPSREPLEEGLYEATISDIKMKKTTKTQEDMMVVEFDVNTDNGKRKVWENYLMRETMLWKLQQLLKACGLDVSGSLSFEESDLIGASVSIQVTQEEYNGNMQNRVNKVI